MRYRLLTRLGDSYARPAVVISGPAGAGKSILASQFLETDDRAHRVVRLAPYDDDPSVLAARVLDALESIGPRSPRDRVSATSHNRGFSPVLLPALAWMAASRARPYVLVLDDVHLLHHRHCLDLLVALVDAVPSGSCVMLLTRDKAPERLARARADRRLVEVGPADLAFDVEEAAQLVSGLDLHLSGSVVAHLVEHSGGWAVGLYLSGLAMQRDLSTRIGWRDSAPRGSDRYILDYVESEVLDPLDEHERSFLVRTSVLDELTPALCNAVVDRTDAAALLPALHDRSQLVVGVGEGRFRCHHLLREALHADLERHEPHLEPVLHERAARWLADNDDLDAAVRHGLASADLSLIAELVWSGIVGCIGSGRPERLVVWLSGLSEHQVSSDPWLSLASAWSAMQSGEPDAMSHWLYRSRAHAGRGWRHRVPSDEYAASLAVLEALVGAGGLEDSVSLCDGALAGLPSDSGFRTAAAFVRGVCQTLLRRPGEGRQSLLEAESLARALDVPIIQADALSWQGVLAVMSGDTVRGSQLIGEATRVIMTRQLDRLASSAHCVTAQALLLALIHEPEAEATLASARRLTAMIPQIAPWFAVCGRLVQARTAALLGDGALARILLADARRAMTPDLAASLARDLLEDTAASLRSLSRDGVSAAALTAAEMRVMQFLPSHLTFRMIGEHLFLSQNTVKTHALSIYRKFAVGSRSDAVAVAVALGLVEGPPRE